MRSGLAWTQAHRASGRARQPLARTPLAQYSISKPAIPGLRGGEGLHQAGSPSRVSRPGPNPRHVPERDATLSNKRQGATLSRRAGLRPLLPDPPPPVPVGPPAGGGQGARAAHSRQEHGVDVSSDSSEPPTGSLHRLQGEPRPSTTHLPSRPGSRERE